MTLSIDHKRTEEMERKHARLWSSDPLKERLITFGCSKLAGVEKGKLWTDPQALLDFCLQRLERVLATGDDTIPMVRVDLGTILFPASFGCDVLVAENSWPAIKTHPVSTPESLANVRHPDPIRSGLLPKAYEFISYFRENLPEGIRLSQCDTQGPWNVAHLMAGDQIFFAMYDDPAFVEQLLDAVADFTIAAIPPMKEAVGEASDTFYLQGTCCPGGGRICNCSTEMISPDFYEQTVLERDNRVFEAMGGGMLHNCAGNVTSLAHANRIKTLRCVEMAFNYADVFDVANTLREDIVLIVCGPVDPPLLTPLGAKTLDRFAKGEFPNKTNILYRFDDPVDEDRTKYLLDVIKG